MGKLIAHPWFKRNSASFLSVRQRCFTGSLIKWHPKNTCQQRRDVGLLGRIKKKKDWKRKREKIKMAKKSTLFLPVIESVIGS